VDILWWCELVFSVKYALAPGTGRCGWPVVDFLPERPGQWGIFFITNYLDELIGLGKGFAPGHILTASGTDPLRNIFRRDRCPVGVYNHRHGQPVQ